MEKKYQVFVSSTYEDLKEERAKVIGTLLENNCIPIGMEQFPSSSLSQWEYITKMIDMSDYYILISAGRYGSINGNTGISYTEQEYDYAVQKGIPVLAFLYATPEKLTYDKHETSEDKIIKLKSFHEKVKQRLAKFYRNSDELSAMVLSSITKAIADCPRIGWVRADQVEKVLQSSEYLAELKRLQQVVANIQENINGKIDAITPQWNKTTEEKMRAIAEQVLEENIADEDEVKQMIEDVFKK